MKQIDHVCPSCASIGLAVFYEVNDMPVHSVLLLPTRDEALNYPTGIIALGFCHSCGFITNLAFESYVHEYSSRYEETQGFSPTFNAFHRRLAKHLIARYDLHHKDVIEIGCGKGEFLAMLCELGDNRGVGFDPAYVPGRVKSDKATFIRDFYSEKYTDYKADFVCCKMTLEHIQDVSNFVTVVRRSMGDNDKTVVFFQVPDVRRIFNEVAFWDIYYEHCSYFSLGSLGRLFQRSGFEIIDLWQDYDGQYLMIEARPGSGKEINVLPIEEDLEDLHRDVELFVTSFTQRLEQWATKLRSFKEDDRKVVLWGGGSKGVAFLTTLQVGLDLIQYVVDINPHKAGTFMAGTGQEIVPPEYLKIYEPDVVIIMNPIYRDEIQGDLSILGLLPKLLTV